jgi:hypothetical protein
MQSVLNELAAILERLDPALDSGRTERTEADLDRAFAILGELGDHGDE